MNPEAKKQVNKLFLFIFLSFLLTSHVAAQSVLSFERIEGLSQSTGYAITKDKQGFLWIATADGLNRYDGVEMRAYKPGRGKTDGYMMGRLIRSDILEDDHERIWFSTDLAVHSFDKKTELFKTWPLSKQNQFANPLLFRDGHLWLANADAGLFDLDISTGESTFYPSTTRLMYNGVSDNNNNLWFASNKGLLQFNLTTKQWQQYFSDKEFYSVAISNDTLFISEKKNILVAPLNTPHNYSFAEFSNQERDLVHRIYADEMKNIWVGDESGNVFFRQHGTKRFQWSGNINRAGRVRTNYPVYCFYYDPSGRLWTGGYMFGLIKAEIRKQGFTVFPQSGSGAAPENIFVNTFFEQGNEVWLGTFQKGIVILDKTTGLTRTFDLPYSGPPLVYGKSVHLIRSDNHGNLWTGSSGYLYVRKKGSGSFTPILIPLVPSALQNPQVWSIAENENGWLIGTNVGVYQVAESANKFAIGHIEALGNSRVAGLCRAPSGEWYIAFESGGIVVTKDPTSSEGQTRIFEDTNVRALYYDDRHSMLWICSSDGLIAWHSASRQHKIVAPDNYTYAVLPDSNDLWVSTNSGLIKASLRYSGNDPLPGATLVTFTTRDGLPDNQFNANAAHKGMSGTFYFGTPSGIVWF
ncbi:MAG TPA: hypothetical protein VFE50_11880 [Cyclobacteriaceae bacterium]|nr:hypothetical protein [Cyclobacteriaceae bacterium]